MKGGARVPGISSLPFFPGSFRRSKGVRGTIGDQGFAQDILCAPTAEHAGNGWLLSFPFCFNQEHSRAATPYPLGFSPKQLLFLLLASPHAILSHPLQFKLPLLHPMENKCATPLAEPELNFPSQDNFPFG